ncbi:Sec-independent protein translocase protein TatB [Chloroflexota bacterium]
MDFFGIGIGELLLIMVVTLIIWGPEKLPEIARTMGRTVNNFKKITSNLTAEVAKEITKEENKHSSLPREDNNKTSKLPDASKQQHQDSETTNLV